MINSKCKYYELLTETHWEDTHETDSYGYSIGCCIELPVGEVCHKKCDYTFDCNNCKYSDNIEEDTQLPFNTEKVYSEIYIENLPF